MHINTDDFVDDEDDEDALFRPNQVHVQFFLQYVKLCKIIGVILLQQYPIASDTRRQNVIDSTISNKTLVDWLQEISEGGMLGAAKILFLVSSTTFGLLYDPMSLISSIYIPCRLSRFFYNRYY